MLLPKYNNAIDVARSLGRNPTLPDVVQDLFGGSPERRAVAASACRVRDDELAGVEGHSIAGGQSCQAAVVFALKSLGARAGPASARTRRQD